MALVIIIVGLVISATIIGLIWFHTKNPNNTYLAVAEKWQTLIGALLGFMFLAGSIALNSNYQADRKKDSNLEKEAAYLRLLSNELNLFQQEIGNHNDVILRDLPENVTAKTCANAVESIRGIPIREFTIEGPFPELVTELTADTTFQISAIIDLRKQYVNMLSAISIQDCVSNPKSSLEALKFANGEVRRVSEGLQVILLSKFASRK